MTDDRTTPYPTTDPSDDSEERQGDWEPMTPETTEPASDAEEAAREQERQLETGEESPS